jgi:short-subunit dehydrogenase
MKRILTNSRILLTGASSGIGAALAVELAKEGAEMVLLARREERLRTLVEKIQREFSDYAPENGTRKILAVVGDVTDSATRQRAIQTATEQLGGVDILINNAGVGATALVEATTEETLRRMMEVNYFALVELTRTALPFLKESAASEERRTLGVCPMVVNLSSIVGLRGVPHYGAYGAAKFAVTGISETMRAEFSKHNIDVLLVCPGTTETEFFDVLLQSSSAPDMPVHHYVTAQYVAVRIIKAMRKGKHKIIPYTQAVILDYLNRFVPGFVNRLMKRYV